MVLGLSFIRDNGKDRRYNVATVRAGATMRQYPISMHDASCGIKSACAESNRRHHWHQGINRQSQSTIKSQYNCRLLARIAHLATDSSRPHNSLVGRPHVKFMREWRRCLLLDFAKSACICCCLKTASEFCMTATPNSEQF